MTILRAFFVLLLFQSAGTILTAATRSPIPGPLVGMGLLALWLLLDRKHAHEALHRTADGLLAWLGLLFVPAGAGVLANLSLLRAAWLPLTVGLAVSTLASLAVTAWVMQSLQSRKRQAA